MAEQVAKGLFCLDPGGCSAYYSAMTLKSAAVFALIGMALASFLAAAVFLRDLSGMIGGAVAEVEFVKSSILLLAALSLTVFFFVFHRAQR
ncbi:hypothetical protein [Paludibaculum fermentans]|uniref:Uncharacterized protein n=1 Tax=Paludibaculum fermentans TaxID=1473598 RepID=A0A7S7NXB1_PALFE|nr:hypothetical protein [Paludibaculum fermentans]QOY91516.1 hypothetical protein IRI77_16680 [Paludibaculum fermentans]